MLEVRPQPSVWPVLLVMALVAGWLQFAFPYREAPRADLTENLGGVFPKLNGVMSSPETRAVWEDFRALYEKYGDPFTVMPAMPLAHYVTGTAPVLPVDWPRDLEMPGDESSYMAALRDGVVLVSKESWSACDESESTICARVLAEGGEIEETAHFRVLRLPAVE
jgi:hypothetical protein